VTFEEHVVQQRVEIMSSLRTDKDSVTKGIKVLHTILKSGSTSMVQSSMEGSDSTSSNSLSYAIRPSVGLSNVGRAGFADVDVIERVEWRALYET
jgi:hypothetical protein